MNDTVNIDRLESKIIRKIKLDIISSKYKCISAYKIPDNILLWEKCPNCKLYPLVWEFDNGRSTGCGCGKNEYNHFSIVAESVMSFIKRNNGSAVEYGTQDLKNNWNHWVKTGEMLETLESLKSKNRY